MNASACPVTLQSMLRVRLVQFSTNIVIVNMPSAQDEHDSSYRRDIRNVFKLNNWILGSIGIWPVAICGIGRHASKIAIAICNLAFSFALVPCALHIIYDEKDIIMRLKLCGLLAFCLTAMTKYCILAIRRPKILRCIEYVKSDWWQVTFRSDREVMLKYATIGRNLTIIGASFMYTAGIIYYMILIPFFSEHKVNNQTIRPLVYPIYSKFRHSQISPVYEIVYVAHCMCGYTIYSVTAGAYGLAALFATHACGQIEVIVSRLEDLLNGERFKQSSKIHQRIASIVKDHVRVIRFAIVVEEVLQEVCLVELTSSVCTICLLEYYCIVDWQQDNKLSLATYFLLLVSFCFNVYILCYIGELLVEKVHFYSMIMQLNFDRILNNCSRLILQSSQIGYICYMINWYQLSPKSARSLILIIAMASHPIKISAGRMVDLSLPTFGNVLKTSVAYLSFLRTLVM
ncbi:odorant receptor 43a-like isoform X1 [Formica exsecta]|uniref:odorant receptor 43a-like isoform X1 n=1 Tax=Formica exsecta TaxID=72781 RepID=UPI00114486EC|nr:odorant receptor 43a-like isoform X1 [Formica exsecta]